MSNLKLCITDKVAARGLSNKPIYVYLNSPGGSIYEGLRFISFAKNIKNLHTITEFSASMAAAIAQILPGKRYIVDHGVFMFHRARGGVEGQFEDGELEARLRLWKKIVRDMEQKQANRIGISLDEYKKRRMNEWWVYGQENVDMKTADEMVSVKCTNALVTKVKTVTYSTFMGPVSFEKSECPLVN